MKPKKEIHPPKWADVLLTWMCSERVIETLQGDLYELYLLRRKRSSKFQADFAFIGDVFSSIRPFALKGFKNSNSNAMFKNYVKVAWRNLLKHKLYSSIKIGGLALGVGVCLLITVFVIDELSHDKAYADKDRIYRLINFWNDPSDKGKWTAHQPMVGPLMKEQFPEVENSARLIPYTGWFFAGDNQVRRTEKKQNKYEDGFAYADPELLEVLEVDMVLGSRSSALSKPNSIVISERKAELYFPGENPIGKTLILDEVKERPWSVGGVMKNPSSKNHLQFDFLLTLVEEEFWNGEQTNWCCSNYNTYIKTKPGVDPIDLQAKMTEKFKENYIPYLESQGSVEMDEIESYWIYELQLVSDIYLYSSDISDRLKNSDIKIVYLFSAISLFILLLACINFINLSTAKSANRAKEVGLRKVVGSFRKDLIKQFLTESIVFTTLAVLIGFAIAWLLTPFFNSLSGKSLEIPFDQWWLYPSTLLFILMVGIISGIYPAFYLSSFRPIEVISGKVSRGAKTSTLRGVMVVFQFTCSMILIVASAVVHQQMQYILNKDLGYDKDHVIMIQGANTLEEKLDLFQNELSSITEVVSVSASNYLPITGTKRDQNEFWNEGMRTIDIGIGAQIWMVDDNYIETLGMRLLEGRDFESESVRDSTSVIINQTFARKLGLDDPVGKRIENHRPIPWTIIGVVEDFHFESVRGEIEPIALAVGRYGSIVPVKVRTNDMQATLSSITSVWENFMPNQPIRYSFMDDVYASMYEDVARTGSVFTAFSIIAILVACLGLFGLSAFMVEQRSKEISIRKVLGASVNVIFKLLTSNFMRLILVSLFLSIPISFYLMSQWLEDFEYRIDLSWTVFVFAGLIIAVIALLTISTESVKAATINPVKGLRSE